MSVLDSLKFAWNGAGFGVSILLDEPLYEDAPVTGKVVLKGGGQPAHVSDLSLEYVGVWYERDENNAEVERWAKLDQFGVPLDVTLAPEQTLALPFQRSFDSAIALTNEYHHMSLHAVVGLTGARDPSATVTVRYFPIEPVATLCRALRERLGWTASLTKYHRDGTPWYIIAAGGVPAHMHETIDSYWVVVTPVAAEHGHSQFSAAHLREAQPTLTPFVDRAGRRCAIAVECYVDREGKGFSGLRQEWASKDKMLDRYVALDVETALARAQAFIEHVHSLGPVR